LEAPTPATEHPTNDVRLIERTNALRQVTEGAAVTVPTVVTAALSVEIHTEAQLVSVRLDTKPDLSVEKQNVQDELLQNPDNGIPSLLDDDLDEDGAAMTANIQLEETLGQTEKPDLTLSNRRVRRRRVRRGLPLYVAAAKLSIQQKTLNMKNKDFFAPVCISSLSVADRRRNIRSISPMKKSKTDGAFDELKAILMFDGAMKECATHDANDLCSSVVTTTSVMCLPTMIAAKERRLQPAIDNGSAYLNVEMDEHMIMMLDTSLASIVVAVWPKLSGHLDDRGRACVRLKKALYDCIKSVKLWFDELKSTLGSWSYMANQEGKCLFNKPVGGVKLTLLLHAHDILSLFESAAARKELLKLATNRSSEVHCDAGVSFSYWRSTFDMSVESVFRFAMYGYTDDPTLEYDRVGLTITSIKGNLFNLFSVDAVLFKEIRAKRLDCFEAKAPYLPEKIRSDIPVVVILLCSQATNATEEAKLDRVVLCVEATSTQLLELSAYGPMERIDNDEAVVVKRMPTRAMLADVLTEPLQSTTFRYLRDRLTADFSSEDVSDLEWSQLRSVLIICVP
jgi:hypothetical protein